jgi:hypothetical protein
MTDPRVMTLATTSQFVQRDYEGVPGALLYSNPYSNAGEKQQTLAICSEHQTRE